MTSALTLAERFGRALMMDFGFGSFLEKIEENFGKFVLRVLLVLIGLAVAVFCMRVIWVNAISPALDLMGAMGVWKWLASVAVAGAAWVLGIATTASITSSFVRWQHIKKAKAIIHETKEIGEQGIAKVTDLVIRAEALIEEAKETHAATESIREELAKVLAEAKKLKDRA